MIVAETDVCCTSVEREKHDADVRLRLTILRLELGETMLRLMLGLTMPMRMMMMRLELCQMRLE